MESMTLTAPELIYRVAALIARRGWGRELGDPLPSLPEVDLVSATCEVIAGFPCQPRHLTDLQAEHLAEVLDHFETALDMTVSEYKTARLGAQGLLVSWEIGLAAWRYEQELMAVA